ncbi:hypothetical protein [Salinicoccus halodurans]|uniref:Uncharacterized protein n=1 Tax=Salinicoccus halodurans TaxID=407035 RepID=A0A0F7HMK3_9STAP|nr:hypothetical protein [Salinicoccus halodurans]AKG74379.1 hypothetical protein AAT16_09110 [Salinicoccus halodurans]SFK95172.1 hypothetical protein SAMN05216235_2720 [Salinicoccus halodurans]
MTEILAGMLGGFVWGTVLLFSTGIFKKHIAPLIFKKEPDEIEMLEQTIWSKREELYRRNQIERLSSEIERLDEHLYPEEKETRRESLNDVYEDVGEYTVNPLRYMGVTAEEAAESHNRATRNLRRGTDRKPVKAPDRPSLIKATFPINALKPVFCAQSNCDRMFLTGAPHLFPEWMCDNCSVKKEKEPGPTYPEIITAYADGVVIQKEFKYPPLKNVGGNADE